MSHNFFLIYISEVFNKLAETSSLVISLFIIDDLSFIALGSLIKMIVKAFEKFAIKIIA